MPSYDININTNDTTKKGSAGRAAGKTSSTALTPSADFNKLSSILKSSVDSNAKSVKDAVSEAIRKELRTAIKSGSVKAALPGIPASEMSRLLKGLERELVQGIVSILTTKMPKSAGASMSQDTLSRAVSDGMMKLADKLAAKLALSVSKMDVDIDERAMSNSIAGAMRAAYPKSAEKATKDLVGVMSKLTVLVKDIGTAASDIKSARVSGGKVGISEIGPVLTDLKKVGKDFKDLSGAVKDAIGSLHSVAKEGTETYSKIKSALTSIEKRAKVTVRGVRERAKDDPALFTKEIVTAFTDVLKKSEALKGTEIGKAINQLTGVVGDIPKLTSAIGELKQVIQKEIATGRLSKEGASVLLDKLENVVTKAGPLPKSMTGSRMPKGWQEGMKAIDRLLARTAKLIAQVKLVVDDSEIQKAVDKKYEIPVKLKTETRYLKDSISSAVSSAMTEAEKHSKKVKLEVADVTQEIKIAFDKGNLDKLVGTLDKLGELSGKFCKGAVGAEVPLSDKVFDKVTVALENVKNVQKQITKETGTSFKELVNEAGRFKKALDESTNALHKQTDQIKDIFTTGPQSRRAAAASYPRTGEERPRQEDVTKALLNQVGKYISTVIKAHPKGEIEVKETRLKEGSVYKKQAEQQAAQLSKSLYNVQKQIIDTLTKQFEEAGNKWAVVIDKSLADPVESFKLPGGRAGRQWTLEIANLRGLERELGGMKGTAQELVRAYKAQYVGKKVAVGTADKTLAVSVGKWLKTTSEAQIQAWDKVTERQQKHLLRIKKGFEDISVVSDEMIESIKGAFGEDLPKIFAGTFAESEALRSLQQSKLIKTLALPAARVTPTGGTAFETVHGSTRAIPKFATFETGFERLFTKLTEKGLVETPKKYAERIKGVGIRPTPSQYGEANKLAMDLFRDLLEKPVEKLKDTGLQDINKQFIKQSYREAIKPKAYELKKTGVITDTKVFEEKVSSVMDEALKAGDSFNKFAAAMEQAGLSAFDVVKSLDKLKFENVYDIYKKIFSDIEGSPLLALGKAPQYERSIREFEKAIGQVEGIMPLVEGGRPRRALHQESIVNVLTRTSQAYGKEERLDPDAQKSLIKDLNLRIDEYINTAIGTGLAAKKLPTGIRTVTSLGIPEAQAGKVEEFRPGAKESGKYLNTLYATSVKMYADDLTALAPFKQFQQAGRNIANVTSAMEDFGAVIETPRLRSAKEKEVIESGRYGTRGYGYNVIAELRTTASTFEDQIVIAGKLAEAVTSAVSTLVKPSAGGRVRAGEEELIKGTGIATIKPKTLVDSIGEANRKILDVLGVEEKYKGRADKALIETVTKAVAVVRGEDVEVQQAKLAETFLNYYGRKLTTRFGSKGVSITPTPMEQDPNIKQVLQKYGEKDIKVMPKAELGVALLPKTMGELASELIEKNADAIEKEFGKTAADIDVSKLAGNLRASGNKFLLDMFKRTEENVVVIREEAEKTQKLFDQYAAAFKVISGVAAKTDIAGIGQLRGTYEKQVGGELIKAKPIDVRISAYGAAKRGLQTEVMESVVANVAGVGAEDVTTLRDEFTQSTIKDLLGAGDVAGILSKYSKSLGFIGTEKPRPEIAESLYKTFGGKGDYRESLALGDEKALQAQRAAALESVSNYYSTVIDEMGKRRKGLVGTKFLQIIEEPHEDPEWQRGQIERGTKGARLNIPAFAAYATVFGEQSEIMKEIQKDLDINAKKHWEYLKALQTVLGKESEMYSNLTKGLEEVDISTILPFERATGVAGGAAFIKDPTTGEKVRDERSFSDTILDLERFSKAFKLMIPTGKYTPEGRAEKEELYIPGPLARGTYPEPLIAGERGLDQMSRRLAHLVNMAKELDDALKAPEAFFDPQYLVEKLPKIIGGLTKRASVLGKKQTGPEEFQELRDIYSQLKPGLSETRTPSQLLLLKHERSLYGEQLPETQFLEKFEQQQKERVATGKFTQQKAMSNIINKMSDMLIGKRTGTEEERAAPAALQRVVREGTPEEAAGFAKTLGIDIVQDVIDRRTEALTKAKIDYYSSLSETALGKTGSINELFFSRKIPAIMGRAVTAVVDKRDDLKIFMNKLQALEDRFAESNIRGVEDLGNISENVADIYKGHTESIKGYERAGIPILKQHELGVPATFAKKVPVAFKRAEIVGRELMPAAAEEEGTLFELLKLKESLQTEARGDRGLEGQVNKFISESLVPYIESIRFPFTGVSTIQPYEPKLLPGVGERGLEKQALMVPGVPEMDITAFDKIIEDLRGKVAGVMAQREEAFEKDLPEEEISQMTTLINELNAAISAIIPKYVAHQQKLDFDGDQIEIHTSTTAKSRKEIEAHYKRLTSFDMSTADVFRDVFSYGAMVPPTGEFPIGQMAGAFEKKFPAGKGFEFLKSPFLTREMEYMTGAQTLGVLGERPEAGSMSKIIEDILVGTLPDLAKQVAGVDPEAILTKMDSTFAGIAKDTDTVAVDLLNSVKTLDKTLGPQLLRIVETGLKSKLYEEKKKDAIFAQLFKIHTGPETEALTRVHRVAEEEVGFGRGMIGRGGYAPTERFKKMFPKELVALGGRPEEEFHTMLNEILRFGIQKGMDVKHAGERPVAGEMVRFLSKGPEGATKLWEQIKGTESSYGELSDFAEANKTAIENRLSALPTSKILKEARTITAARGEGIVLDNKTREELKQGIVDRVGLKGFLEELSIIIQSAAIEGVMKDIEAMEPAKRRKELKGRDIKSFAISKIKEQMVSEGGIDIRESIIAQKQPLYPMRAFGATPGTEYKKFESKYGKVPTPKLKLPSMGEEQRESFVNKYKAAIATAQNIQDALSAFGKSQEKGTYIDMIGGAIGKLQEDQNKIEDILTVLNKESYDFESKNIDLVERLTTGKGISAFATGIINMKEGLGKRLEELSDVAAVPLLSELEELDLEQVVSPKLLSYKVEELKGAGIDISSEEAKSIIEDFVTEGIEKAKALKQLDRVFESISSKRYESRVISGLTSPIAKAAPITMDVGRQDIQRARDILKTQRLGGRPAAGGGIPFTMAREGGIAPSIGGAGDIVPVHVVSIAEGVTVGIRDLESLGMVAVERAAGTPTRIEREDAAEKAELDRLISKIRGTIPETAYRTTKEVYSPSKLAAGGEYEYQAGRRRFDYEAAGKQQIERIKQKMTVKTEASEFMKAAADVGTAIHAKLEQELKKRGDIDTEVYGQMEDVFGGVIGGTADIIEYTSPEKEKIKLVGDIKTTAKSTIDELDKIGKEKVLYYEDIKDELSGKLAFKIEEAVSQLNTYLKIFEDKLAKGAQAEIRFYDKEGLGKDVEKFKAVRFEFDEARFHRDMLAVAEARQQATGEGLPFVKSASAGQAVGAGATSEEIDRAVELAHRRSRRVSGRPSMTMARDPKGDDDLDRKLREAVDRIEKRTGAFKTEEELDRYLMPPPIAEGAGIGAVFENLKTMHDQARMYQGRKGIDVDAMKKMPKQIEMLVKEAEETGGDYQAFIDVIDKLRELDPTGKQGGISGMDIIKAWKLYRLAIGEFMIKQIEQAKNEMEELQAAGEQRGANVAYTLYQKRVSRLQDFVSRSIGKRTDIYTDDRRFITPGLAKAAGVYQTPEQIIQKSAEPLGEEDVKLREVFDKITKDLKSDEGITAPLEKIREALSELSGMDKGMVALLTNAERVKRLGPQVVEAWADLDKVSDRVTKLREALQQIMKFNQDEFGAVQKKNLDNMIKYLKSIENMYSQMDLGKVTQKQQAYGEMGLVKVPKFLAPEEQRALHARNIMKAGEYFRKPEAEGGPEVGERFSYTAKVMGSAGEVIKNVTTHFHKYGEVVTEAGEKVGQFSTKQKDLIKHMQMTNASFGSAIKRVVMWGAASRLVYGGISYLSKSLSDISELEQGIAQLRMVMSPMQTDFEEMQKAAVGFSKEYGVPTTDVLKSMKIFAQQGLKQQDVIDRTGTATLASNVTTLSAKEATEALTAAMKVFRAEGSQSLRFLDAWSETEAKHAITAADMANAIKKSAAAARTAGVDFDQLNGIVAAIGSVTRQTGKEVGTSLRFIFRRLFSEKGPKELAKINIPVLEDTGELRSGFEVLGDLASRWKDLTSAQKLNIAQSIGGTRQYNALIVLMNNWDEALRGIKNSENSKGSAERRNIEIMKTYAKQLEQTKASATELKLSLSKIVLPTFKAGLTAVRTLVDALNSIPNSMKAVAAFGALFIGYAAKGLSLVDGIRETLAKGGTLFGDLGGQLSKQLNIAKFEILGKGTRGLDVFGLKTVTPKAAEVASKLKGEGEVLVQQGKHLSDFNSGLGQTLFMVKSVGEAYNKFIGDILKGTGAATQKVGEMAMSTGDFMSFSAGVVTRETSVGDVVQEVTEQAVKRGLSSEAVKRTLAKHGTARGMAKVGTKALGFIPEVAGLGIAVGGKALDEVGGLLGKTGEKLSEKTGLAKALGPLAVTTVALLPAMRGIYEYWSKIINSAQDYENSMAGVRRKTESEHKSIRDMSSDYDVLVSRLEEVKELSKPEVKARRQELETYTAPLTLLQPLQEDAIDLSNKLANENINLVLGYDKLGNAILKTTGTFRKYLSELDKLKVKEAAQTEIDILDKYIYDLTTTEGPEKWKKTIKKLLESTPILGDLAGKQIKVSPAAVLEEAATKLNKLINIKNKYPLSTAADEDIKRLQELLGRAREGYQEAFSDFKRVYTSIVSPSALKGLTAKDITAMLSQDVLKKAYELELKVNPRFKLVSGVKAEDIMGKDILTALSPRAAGLIDVTAEFTKANIESAGLMARKGGLIKPGDLVTFIAGDDAARDIAGRQALVKYKETADGIFEWVIQYFNTKTLKVEERPFDEDIERIVDNIFPLQKIQEDLEIRMDSLNTFVAGASAGLTGISAKEFKKAFSLGERFFESIPTTTLVQATKGFTPEKGFGPVEFKKDWYKEINKYFFKPMEEFQNRAAELSKLKLGGLEDITLSKQLFEEITTLNEVLKNNQIAIQFRALYSDMEKSFAEGERVLKEGLAVNAMRRRADLETGGLMAGVPRGLAGIDLGVTKPRDLTAQQRLLRGSGEFRQRVGGIQDLETITESLRSRMDLVARAMANIDTIAEQARGFGAEIKPEEMEKFVEKVVGAEGLEGIEKLIDIDSRVADHTSDTVSRLDDILSNMGDPDSLERVIKKFAYPEKLSTEAIPNVLEKLARVREKFEEKGDQESVISVNRMIDNLSRSLVDRLGFKEAAKAIDTNFTFFRKRFRPEELTQRAFGGTDLKTIFSKLSEHAPTATGGFLGLFKKKAFADSKELSNLRELQEDDGKRSVGLSRNIAKLAAVSTVISTLQKGGTNDIVNSLNDQIKVLESQIEQDRKAGKGEKELRGLFVKKEGITERREELLKDVDFYGMVQSLSGLTTISAELASAFGLTEKQIKFLGVGAVGTYAAVKLASTVIGKELPESAKVFGEELKKVASGVVKGEKFKPGEAAKAAKAFASDIKEKTKEALGKTPKEFKKEVDEVALREAYTKYKTKTEGVDPAEYERLVKGMFPEKAFEAGEIGEAAARAGGAGPSRFKQAIAAYIAATLADFTAKGFEDKQLMNTLDKAAKEQSEQLGKLLLRYPEAAQKALDELRGSSEKAVGKVEGSFELESRLLDPRSEREKIEGAIQSFGEHTASSYAQVMKDLVTEKAIAAHQQFAEELSMAIESTSRSIREVMDRSITESKYGRTARLNKSLVGFGGEAQLPLFKEQMSVQQRVYADAQTTLREGFFKLVDTLDTIGAKRLGISKSDDFISNILMDKIELKFRMPRTPLKDISEGKIPLPSIGFEKKQTLREAITAYAAADSAIDIMVSSIDDLIAKAREQEEVVKASSDTTTIKLAKEQHEKLNEEIERQSGILDDFIGKMREFGKSKRYLDEFSGALYKLNDAILNIGIDQKVEELPGFKGAMSEIDKLLGGPHPLARYIPTVEEERMAGKQGVLVDTKQDVERARLLEQLRTTSAAGGEIGDIYRRLRDLPLEAERELYRTGEQREAERLKEQVAPYKTYLRDLEAVKQLEGLPEEQKIGIGDLQSEIIRAIKESVTVAPKDVRLDELQDAFFSFSNLWKNIRGKGIGLGEYREEFGRLQEGAELQYRGITLEDRTGALAERMGEVRESMIGALKEAPTLDMMKMRAAVAEPVVDELKVIQGLLLEQAKESGDAIDISNLENTIKTFREATTSKAAGGTISGPGGPTADRIPAMLSAGEYVIKTSSAKKLGYGALDYMNTVGAVPGFADGGTVFGGAAGAMKSAADFFKEKRLDIADWIQKPSGTTSGLDRSLLGSVGMGAMAIPDIGLRLMKAPLDFLSGIEQLSKLQVEGKLGETAKEIYSSVKDLNLDKIKGISKGVVDSAVKDLSEGGTGITAGVLEALIPSGLLGAGVKKGKGLMSQIGGVGDVEGKIKKAMRSKPVGVEDILEEVTELESLYPTNALKNLRSVNILDVLPEKGDIGGYFGKGYIGLKRGAAGKTTMAHEFGHYLGDFDHSLWAKLKKGAPTEHERGFMKLYTKFADDSDRLKNIAYEKALSEKHIDTASLIEDVVPRVYSLKTYPKNKLENIGLSSEMLSTSLQELRDESLQVVPESVKLTKEYLKERLKYKDLIDVHEMKSGGKVKGFADGGRASAPMSQWSSKITEETLEKQHEKYKEYLKSLPKGSREQWQGIDQDKALDMFIANREYEQKKEAEKGKRRDPNVYMPDKFKRSRTSSVYDPVSGKSFYGQDAIEQYNKFKSKVKTAVTVETFDDYDIKTVYNKETGEEEKYKTFKHSPVVYKLNLDDEGKEIPTRYRFTGYKDEGVKKYSSKEAFDKASKIITSGILGKRKDRQYKDKVASVIGKDVTLEDSSMKTDIQSVSSSIIQKDGTINQERLRDTLLKIKSMEFEKNKIVPKKSEDRVWWDNLKFWQKDFSKSDEVGFDVKSVEKAAAKIIEERKLKQPGRGVIGTLGHVVGTVARAPGDVYDWGAGVVDWGVSGVKSVYRDTKDLAYRFTDWTKDQYDMYSKPETYTGAYKDVKSAVYNELMLDRDLLLNKYYGIKDFLVNAAGSFRYNMREDSVPGGYKPVVTPKLRKRAQRGIYGDITDPSKEELGTPTKDDTWMGKLKGMADISTSGIFGRAESIYAVLSRGIGDVIGVGAGAVGLPFGLEQAKKNFNYVSDKLTYVPQTEKGMKSLYELSLGSMGYDPSANLKQMTEEPRLLEEAVERMGAGVFDPATNLKQMEEEVHLLEGAVEKIGSGKKPVKYFTSYMNEGIQKHGSREKFEEAMTATSDRMYSGNVKKKAPINTFFNLERVTARRKAADKDLFTKVFPFGKEHPEPKVQKMKYAYDNLVKLSSSIDSGEFRDSELEKYKLYRGKSFGDSLTKDEYTDFENRYSKSKNFILNGYMQAHKSLKDSLLPAKRYPDKKVEALYNKVLEDSAVTTTMLGGIKQYETAKTFGGYKKAREYNTIDPNLANEYKRKLESGTVSDEEKKGYESKFEILKAAGGKELYPSLTQEYRDKYNNLRSGVLTGKNTLEDAKAFFEGVEGDSAATTAFTKSIIKPPTDVEASIKNIIASFKTEKDVEATMKTIMESFKAEEKEKVIVNIGSVVHNNEDIINKYPDSMREELRGLNPEALRRWHEEQFKTNNLSLKGYAHGGVITRTGPVFAHKGEHVVPKGYALGGMAELSTVDSKSINNVTVTINAESLMSELASMKLKVEEPVLKVDVPAEGIKVDMPAEGIKVEMPTDTIKVDMPTDTIKVDMPTDTIKVDMPTEGIKVKVDGDINAVGSEKLDRLAECVKGLEDRLLYVKNDLGDKISIINAKEDTDDYRMEVRVKALINSQLADIEQQLVTIRSSTTDYNGSIVRVDSKLTAMIQELERRLTTVFNFAPNQGYV